MKVHVAQVVRSQIAVWSRQEGKEIGGILLGRVQRRGDSVRRVRVEAAVLAAGAESVGSSIRLTPELVAALTRQAKAEYPTFEVVGWFHTHHGLGAFLSGYDTTVHKEHFPSPWQIALVFDPVVGNEAIYINHGDELVPYTKESEDYYDLIPLSGSRYRLVDPKRFLATVALLVVVVAAATGLWRWFREPSAPVTPGGPPAQQTEAQPQDPATSQPSGDGVPAPGSETGEQLGPGDTVYTVQPNDTLWGISQRYYGRGSYFGLILEHNQISNPRELVPGQELLLPPLPDPPTAERSESAASTHGGN
ncbi:MAG TPA: LysM peptidoglycan-binding domain-containing protein [Firmicutes bacterium]|jgi:nucleoid-associated protein YgaU|nr:LysM peptidoglycan-binding domain-containing protein [Bacillota bacterium]